MTGGTDARKLAKRIPIYVLTCVISRAMPGDKLLLIEGMEAARLHPWESCKLAAQNADLAKTPAAGPT